MPQPPALGCRTQNGVTRCWWCGDDPLYTEYHDNEWGRPVYNDDALFEKIVLEGFQSGLSWITILRKREAFRDAFHGFEVARVAKMKDADVKRLLKNAGIVRHRGKIESAIHNAQQALALQDELGSLSTFFWSFRPAKRVKLRHISKLAAATDESTALSKELKRRGWSFVGPTTCYAFMQAMGMVNDHFARCGHWQPVEDEQLAGQHRVTSRRDD